jgi:hypothetical protein
MKKPSPKIDFESKPQITIDINPVHEAFLRFIFASPEKCKYVILSRRQDIGRLIFSHIMAGDFQSKRPLMDHAVTFILPVPRTEIGYWLRYRHIYIPGWAQSKINDAIDYEFRCWVKDRFRIGYEEENMEQKTIINAILRGLNVRNNTVNFDMIKKIDYRNKRKKEEIQFKRLLTLEKSEIY